jgi:hypothetical protein
MSSEPEHARVTYNEVHNMIKASAAEIQAGFRPDMFIAIGKRSRDRYLPSQLFMRFAFLGARRKQVAGERRSPLQLEQGD